MSPGYHLEQLASGVYARLGSGPIQPNVGIIVGPDGVVLFDASYSPAAARAVAEDVRRLTSRPITTVVISHHHWDHAWGSQTFGAARVIGHTNARTALLERAKLQRESLRAKPTVPAAWMGIPPEQLVAEIDELEVTPPTLTYTEAASLWVGGREVQLRHFGAAHTYGDTLVWLPGERILFGGDVVCNRLIPVVGDGDPFHFQTVLATLADLQPATIVPGHGQLAGTGELRAYAACLEALCDEVALARQQGAPDATAALEQVRLADYPDWAGREILAGSVRRIWTFLNSAAPAEREQRQRPKP